MQVCNVTVVLLHWLLVSIIFESIFQVADGTKGGRRKASPSLVPCPHPKCQCRQTKKGGLSVTCDKIFGSLPTFVNVNSTFELFSVAKRNITSLPAGGFNGIQTRILDIGSNSLTAGQISESAFRGLGDVLHVMWMSDCGLHEVPSESLGVLEHLRVLHLEGNRLTRLSARFLAGNRNLRELLLFENEIESIDVDSFADMSSLEQLKLGQNRIRNLPARVFSSLVNLTSLDLSRNFIQIVSAGMLSGLKSLRWLQLDSNQIGSLEKDSFRGARNLRNMKIENNPLITVAPGSFRAVNKLRYLSIDFGNVTALTAGTLSGLGRLQTLSLGEVASNGSPLPTKLLGSAHSLKRVSLTDYQGAFGGLWKNTFSDKLVFKSLSVFLTPIRDCQCNLPWVVELTTAGAYVHGYCENGQPLSCTSKPVKTGKMENEKKIRIGDAVFRKKHAKKTKVVLTGDV